MPSYHQPSNELYHLRIVKKNLFIGEGRDLIALSCNTKEEVSIPIGNLRSSIQSAHIRNVIQRFYLSANV